jgi:hypothetical protein
MAVDLLEVLVRGVKIQELESIKYLYRGNWGGRGNDGGSRCNEVFRSIIDGKISEVRLVMQGKMGCV